MSKMILILNVAISDQLLLGTAYNLIFFIVIHLFSFNLQQFE